MLLAPPSNTSFHSVLISTTFKSFWMIPSRLKCRSEWMDSSSRQVIPTPCYDPRLWGRSFVGGKKTWVPEGAQTWRKIWVSSFRRYILHCKPRVISPNSERHWAIWPKPERLLACNYGGRSSRWISNARYGSKCFCQTEEPRQMPLSESNTFEESS